MSKRFSISGTSNGAVDLGVEPVSVRARGFGSSYTFEAPDRDTFEDWIALLAEAACVFADDGNETAAEAVYRDIERAGLWGDA